MKNNEDYVVDRKKIK